MLTFNLNRAAEVYKFEDGDLDATHDLNEGDIQRFRGDPRWSPFMQPEPDHTIYGEVLNNEVPPFDNVEVRRAVAAGIDREQLRLYRPSSFTCGEPGSCPRPYSSASTLKLRGATV